MAKPDSNDIATIAAAAIAGNCSIRIYVDGLVTADIPEYNTFAGSSWDENVIVPLGWWCDTRLTRIQGQLFETYVRSLNLSFNPVQDPLRDKTVYVKYINGSGHYTLTIDYFNTFFTSFNCGSGSGPTPPITQNWPVPTKAVFGILTLSAPGVWSRLLTGNHFDYNVSGIVQTVSDITVNYINPLANVSTFYCDTDEQAGWGDIEPGISAGLSSAIIRFRTRSLDNVFGCQCTFSTATNTWTISQLNSVYPWTITTNTPNLLAFTHSAAGNSIPQIFSRDPANVGFHGNGQFPGLSTTVSLIDPATGLAFAPTNNYRIVIQRLIPINTIPYSNLNPASVPFATSTNLQYMILGN